MGKYLKSFEELKQEFRYQDGNTKDLIDDDTNAQEDYSRRSRFGRNPESNVMEAERMRHMDFDTFVVVFVCSAETKTKNNQRTRNMI